MQELIPLGASGIIGLLASRIASARGRVALFVALCLAVGALVSYLAGELDVWWGFLTVDAGLVWLGGLLAMGAVAAWQRYRAGQAARRPNMRP